MQSMDFAQQVILAGVIATAVLDLWQWLVKLVFGVPPTNWALVGRWFSYIPHGKLVHEGIGNSEPVPREAAMGWIAHYAVGLIYAAIYVAFAWFVLGSGPTFPSALGFGVITVIAPWLLLQPGMGLGIFARNAAKPNVVRAHSLSSHVAFGVGLYLGISALAAVG